MERKASVVQNKTISVSQAVFWEVDVNAFNGKTNRCCEKRSRIGTIYLSVKKKKKCRQTEHDQSVTVYRSTLTYSHCECSVSCEQQLLFLNTLYEQRTILTYCENVCSGHHNDQTQMCLTEDGGPRSKMTKHWPPTIQPP